MSNFLYLYQHIPYHLDPVAFYFLGLPVDWYSLMYLAGFLVVYFLLRYRIAKGEFLQDSHSRENGNLVSNHKISTLDSRIRGNDNTKETLLDLMLVTFGGLLVGGRLGYVLFYNLQYYIQNPMTIISPFDPVTHQFVGIFGMSYHGALIGALLAAWIFIKIRNNPIKYQRSCPPKAEFSRASFWQWANFIAPAIPAGYFFGRIGNFMNGELYGRATKVVWGMYFPADSYGILRHPSELYEAFLEGIVLFLILWPFRNHPKIKDHMLALYIIGYAMARIMAEFFRQPDPQVGYIFSWLTLGQILSFLMLIFGISLIFIRQKNKKMV